MKKIDNFDIFNEKYNNENEIIKKIQSVLSEDLLKSDWKKKISDKDHITKGHCYAATEALYYLLGGKDSGYIPQHGRTEEGTHWWLKNKNGKILDPTAEQFYHIGMNPPYNKGIDGGFLTNYPSKRSQEIINRVNNINESIKDYLKPKTDEEIQKSLNGLSKEDAYLKFLKYELYELTYKLKNDLKYFKISSDDYNEIHDIYEKNLFNGLEKQNIDNIINKNDSRNNYAYETPNLESSIGEIFCLEIRVNGYIYIIDKYSNYITIYMEKINRYKHYYICPSFKELLQFLDDFMITARRIY